MARQNNKEVIDLNPVFTDSSIKIDKVTISFEKSGSAKVRFTVSGKTFSHGVGRLDDEFYRDRIIGICKNIAIDLKMGRFDADKWKFTYFGIDKDSQVINFPKNKPINLPPVKSELTLVDIWENYLKVKGDRLSYNSLNGSIKGAETRLNYAISVDPSCIYLDNINVFIKILKNKYSDQTLINDFKYYNSACNLAIKQGKIKGNPFSVYLDKLSRTPKNGMGAVLCFTKQEKDIIIKTFYDNPYPVLSNCKDKHDKYYYQSISFERALYFAPLIELKFLTGLRPGEAHALKWTDIKDHGTPVISITKSVTIDGKKLKGTKTGLKRTIPINSDLAGLIDRLPRIPNKENLIFPSVSSLPYLPTNGNRCYVSYYFSSIVDSLFDDGLIENNLTYYCTRHYFATQLIRAGLDIATVAAWLGDKQSTVMDYYYAADQSMIIPTIL